MTMAVLALDNYRYCASRYFVALRRRYMDPACSGPHAENDELLLEHARQAYQYWTRAIPMEMS